MNYKTRYHSPLGLYLLTSDGVSLTGCYLENQKYFPEMAAFEEKELPIFEQTKTWLDAYFSGEKPELSELKLAPKGSEFRQKVWQILCKIPAGQTTTYGEIARKLGIRSGQAIGGAVGHNPISVIIPCHRVLGADGSLTGYAGGLSAKRYLLALEGVDLPEQLNLF